MPPGDEYAPLGGGGGKLKLKGNKVNDGRIEKKKKKKEKKKTAESSANTTEGERETEGDSSTRREKDSSGAEAEEGGGGAGGKEGAGPGGEIVVGKTEAEKRYEEQRRKRLQDRLKREGVKTHKERVEELNKYLSRLTEHHDMPKIGPG